METMQEKKEETDDIPKLSQKELENVLNDLNIESEKVHKIISNYDTEIGDKKLCIDNIVAQKSVIKMGEITIQAPTEALDLIETKHVDGKNVLMITITDKLEMDGIDVI